MSEVPRGQVSVASARREHDDPHAALRAPALAGGAAPAGQAAPPPLLTAEPVAELAARLAATKGAARPVCEAAKPLLLALAQIGQLELRGTREIELLRELLRREVTVFRQLCAEANVARLQATAASYCLCTALDEAIGYAPWSAGATEAGVWSTGLLASYFHADVAGGQKVFLLLDKLLAQPEEHTDLLGLMASLLGLGFRGQHRDAAGVRRLEAMRQELQTGLAIAPPEDGLSKRWRGDCDGQFRHLSSMPVWLTGAVCAVVLAVTFGMLKLQLMDATGSLIARVSMAKSELYSGPRLRR